jgi:2-oxoacid:acceptor oxidoreductase delta subunit (pyruvate/2-ketoisovalerate family)
MSEKELEFLEFGKANLIGTAPKDSWRVERPEIDLTLCKKCAICIDYCIEGCIHMQDEIVTIDYRLCKGCGVCANECPTKAIKMVKEHY